MITETTTAPETTLTFTLDPATRLCMMVHAGEVNASMSVIALLGFIGGFPVLVEPNFTAVGTNVDGNVLVQTSDGGDQWYVFAEELYNVAKCIREVDAHFKFDGWLTKTLAEKMVRVGW